MKNQALAQLKSGKPAIIWSADPLHILTSFALARMELKVSTLKGGLIQITPIPAL